VGLGLHPDFATAIAKMTRVGQVFMPQPEAQQTYERLYSEVYQRMYKQLKPLYLSIREITGYPA
jgi:sugar (pentulose or hexulose) kinase